MITVTQALSPFVDLTQIPEHRLNYAATRGTMVHRACSAYAQGLWVPAMDEDYQPFFDSFKNWFDQYVEHVLWCERELIDEAYGFKGHPDVCCYLTSGEKVIVDYKTPITESPIWKAQVAAYCHLSGVNHGMSLRLKPDGSQALANRYTHRATDFAAFLSALNAYRYFKQ